MTLTLGLPERMFSMAHLHMMENNFVKLFWNPSTIVEVMVQTNLDGQTHTCAYERTYIHQAVIVTNMSRSLEAG